MILKYKQFIKEGLNNTNPPYYFLRWTSSPEDDKIRNFSGHLQCWVDSEEECYKAREREEDEPSVLLGEEAESETWWLDYRNENNDKLSFWNRYYKYL